MSPALLSRRLTTLVNVGLARRHRRGRHAEYLLSDAGQALAPTVLSLAAWSKEWLPATLSADRADPDLIMWDMHRRMNLDRMPVPRVVIRFEFTDQPRARRRRWIIRDRDEIGLCLSDPGYEIDLFVQTDSFTVNLVWYGDLQLAHALKEGSIDLHGPRQLCDDFPSWLQLNMMAGVPRRHRI